MKKKNIPLYSTVNRSIAELRLGLLSAQAVHKLSCSMSTLALVTARNQLRIIYPQSSVTYLYDWPEEVDLFLPCVADQMNVLNITWYKDGTTLNNSAAWRSVLS